MSNSDEIKLPPTPTTTDERLTVLGHVDVEGDVHVGIVRLNADIQNYDDMDGLWKKADTFARKPTNTKAAIDFGVLSDDKTSVWDLRPYQSRMLAVFMEISARLDVEKIYYVEMGVRAEVFRRKKKEDGESARYEYGFVSESTGDERMFVRKIDA